MKSETEEKSARVQLKKKKRNNFLIKNANQMQLERWLIIKNDKWLKFSIELSSAHYCFYMREWFTYGYWAILLPSFDFTGNSPNPKVSSSSLKAVLPSRKWLSSYLSEISFLRIRKDRTDRHSLQWAENVCNKAIDAISSLGVRY